jgi:hypothetical protein
MSSNAAVTCSRLPPPGEHLPFGNAPYVEEMYEVPANQAASLTHWQYFDALKTFQPPMAPYRTCRICCRW